jgi:hypothetical protein
MSLLREPADWQHPEKDRTVGAGTHHKVVRRSSQRIGRGAFACPCCNLPLLPGGPVAVSAPVECPFCREVRPARHFVRLNAVDTPQNEVYLRARLPAG